MYNSFREDSFSLRLKHPGDFCLKYLLEMHINNTTELKTIVIVVVVVLSLKFCYTLFCASILLLACYFLPTIFSNIYTFLF